MPICLRRSRSRLLARDDKGLSVMEMVVAISVTVVVLISAGAAFLKMGEAQRSAEAADRGTQMVQDKLETIHKLRYDKVGCFANDKVDGVSVCPTNAPATTPVNSSNGERTVTLVGERKADDPVLAPAEDSIIGDANGNKYKVTTVVTWADLRDPNRTDALQVPPESVPGDYRSKRVTVTASWTMGGKTRTVTRQWLRSPTFTEQLPPAAGAALIGSTCAYKAPFCSIEITEGQVLQAVSGFPASRAIQFTVQMSVTTQAADITYGTLTKHLPDPLGGGITNGGRTLTYVIPNGGATGGVEPGANTVTIGVDTDYGHATVTKVVNWRTPPVTASPYQLASLHGVWDTSRAVDTNLAPPTCDEDPSNWFCVKLTDNTLWRYTAVIADEKNVDEMDGYTRPKLYATGMDPADPNPKVRAGVLTDDLSQHPSKAFTGYKPFATPEGGYVGTQNLSNGTLNTIRWSYGFQPGTKFPGTSSNIIISGGRPGDGAAANASLTMPVIAVPYVTDCLKANEYVPLKAVLSGTATGATNTLNWTAPFGADSYKLYRVGSPDTLINTVSSLTLNDSGRPWGLPTSYYVVAYKGTVAGNPSDTLTLTTGPGPTVLSGLQPTGQTNNLSWQAVTGADTYTLYRGGVAIYSGANLSASDSSRPWGLKSSYYVTTSKFPFVGATSNLLDLTTIPDKPAKPTTTTDNWNFTVWCPTITGATYNKILRSDGSIADGIIGQGWLDPNIIYHATSTTYKCAGGNAGGTGAWSDAVAVSGYSIVPDAPTGLYLASAWGLSHTYAWSATAGATQYWLAHSTGTPAVTVTGTIGTLSLAVESTYSISVYACSASGRWSAPSVAVQTDTPFYHAYLGNLTLRPSTDNESHRSNSMVSANGQYVLLMQVDGNLVMYGPGSRSTVHRNAATAGEPNTAFVFQTDGHPALYRYIDYGAPYIAAIRYTGVLGYWLHLNDDGNLVEYSWDYRLAMWTSDANVNTLFRP